MLCLIELAWCLDVPHFPAHAKHHWLAVGVGNVLLPNMGLEGWKWAWRHTFRLQLHIDHNVQFHLLGHCKSFFLCFLFPESIFFPCFSATVSLPSIPTNFCLLLPISAFFLVCVSLSLYSSFPPFLSWFNLCSATFNSSLIRLIWYFLRLWTG